MEPNKYLQTAEWYDFDNRKIVEADIPFFLEYAQQINGKILELACGTGRLTIPFARAGFETWGLDLSEAMLKRFREKLSLETAEVQQRIRLQLGDMSQFEFSETFDLILIAFRSFQALTNDKSVESCLKQVRKHLSEDGRFILNVFRPYRLLDESWLAPEVLDMEMEDEERGLQIRRSNMRRRIDVSRQIIYPEIYYDVTNKEGQTQRYTEELNLRYYYAPQIKELLLNNGFEIVESFGDYDKKPIGEGGELIFILKNA